VSTSSYRGIAPGLGGRLRQERERLGLTMDEVCRATHITRKTLYNYEMGDSTVTADFLDRFAKIGGDAPRILFGSSDALSPAQAARQSALFRRSLLFALEFCRDPKGRPTPLNEEVINWIMRAYETIAKDEGVDAAVVPTEAPPKKKRA